MAETTTLSNLGQAMGLAASPAAAPAKPAEPKLDAQGRAYATGRRKNAISRVWIKRGKGKIPSMARPLKAILPVRCCA